MKDRFFKMTKMIWKDPDFLGLKESEKLITFYCLSGSQTNFIGIFNFSIALAAEDFETSPQSFRKAFEKVCKAFGWKYDNANRVLYIPSWWKTNTPNNPNVLKSFLADMQDLPQTPLLKDFINNRERLPESFHETFNEFIANLSERLPQKTALEEDSDTDSEEDTEKDSDPEGKQPNLSPCPHEKIIEKYHEHLPMLPKVKVWDGKRKKDLKSRWDENKEMQSVESWEAMFQDIAKRRPFLLGENDRGWKGNLGWFAKKENFLKIVNGEYVSKKSSGSKRTDKNISVIKEWLDKDKGAENEG